MEIYQITYQEYIALMTRVKNEIDKIINITPDNTRKMMAINTSSSIERTIMTAQAEINLPSAELEQIVSCVVNLRICGAKPIPEVDESLKHCFGYLSLAVEVLHKITDDSYLDAANKKLAYITNSF